MRYMAPFGIIRSVGTSDPECYEFEVTGGADHDGLTVRWGGLEALVHSIPIETPAVPYVLLKFCVSGTGVFEAEDNRWDISPGMVFFSGMRIPNVITADRDEKMINLAVLLGGKG